jgi:hypothetical protein
LGANGVNYWRGNLHSFPSLADDKESMSLADMLWLLCGLAFISLDFCFEFFPN